MMGGTIWIKSELGSGATFTFTIQVKRSGNKQRALSQEGINWGNVRILVVDDEYYILNDFNGILGVFGVPCDIAPNADEALRLIEQNGGYDIYFVDWKMPGKNGIELAKELKQIPHAHGDPIVVIISSSDSSAIAAEANDAGVDKFLQKPLFPSTIVDIINEFLGVPVQKPEETEASIENIFKGHHILIAEDVDINREIVQALLEPTLLEIDFAVNGLEAVRMINENPGKYEMIFMDVQMPEMDGYESTRRIRTLSISNAETIPIIAMTANVFKEDIENCLAAGMNGHVGKPLDINEVLRILKNYLL